MTTEHQTKFLKAMDLMNDLEGLAGNITLRSQTELLEKEIVERCEKTLEKFHADYWKTVGFLITRRKVEFLKKENREEQIANFRRIITERISRLRSQDQEDEAKIVESSIEAMVADYAYTYNIERKFKIDRLSKRESFNKPLEEVWDKRLEVLLQAKKMQMMNVLLAEDRIAEKILADYDTNIREALASDQNYEERLRYLKDQANKRQADIETIQKTKRYVVARMLQELNGEVSELQKEIVRQLNAD